MYQQRQARSYHPIEGTSIELEREAREASAGELVERGDVLLGGLVSQGADVLVAHRDELVVGGVNHVEEVAVALLGLLGGRVVVRPQGQLAVVDQPPVLLLEEVELALDEVGETRTAKAKQSGS